MNEQAGLTDRLLTKGERLRVSLPCKYPYDDIKDIIHEACLAQDAKTFAAAHKVPTVEEIGNEIREYSHKQMATWLLEYQIKGIATAIHNLWDKKE